MSTDLELALALLGGAPFTSLHEGVKEAVRTTARFRYLLRDLKNTLESLQRVKTAIERIQLYNEELSLPAGEIQDLQKKMEDGAELVFRLSNLRLWNYCCLHCYNDELVDLDRSLRRLFEDLQVEESRNVLEILELSRNTQRTVDELKSKLEFNIQREFDELKSILSNMERNLIQQHEANYDRQQGGDMTIASTRSKLQTILSQAILITVWDDFPEEGLNADDKAAKASANPKRCKPQRHLYTHPM